MAQFAIVENELVVNIIIAESQEIANEVVYLTASDDIAVYLGNNEDGVGIGWTYNNGHFAPPPEEEKPKPKII